MHEIRERVGSAGDRSAIHDVGQRRSLSLEPDAKRFLRADYFSPNILTRGTVPCCAEQNRKAAAHLKHHPGDVEIPCVLHIVQVSAIAANGMDGRYLVVCQPAHRVEIVDHLVLNDSARALFEGWREWNPVMREQSKEVQGAQVAGANPVSGRREGNIESTLKPNHQLDT